MLATRGDAGWPWDRLCLVLLLRLAEKVGVFEPTGRGELGTGGGVAGNSGGGNAGVVPGNELMGGGGGGEDEGGGGREDEGGGGNEVGRGSGNAESSESSGAVKDLFILVTGGSHSWGWYCAGSLFNRNLNSKKDNKL